MSHVFDNLYPAIVQCFGVILLGYIAGRLNIVTSTQSKGLGTFVSHFALPGIVIRSLINLNFSTVNWKFLGAILIAKSLVFVLVLVFSFLLLKPRQLGLSGLNGIFATQSNDFGVGYPIVMALYQDSNPELIQYIALVVPISFLILNPIGYIMLEIDKRRASSARSSKCSVIAHTAKGVLLNPVVMFTIIGIIANFIFRGNVPTVIEEIIDEFANSFSATTLFYLGLSMVGKISSQLKGRMIVTPLLLIFSKMILLPLTIREMVNLLQAGHDANSTQILSDFGFLYGTFPTAPTVFIYASMYGVAQNMVASAMVVCTFLSAPLMFVSARMVTLKIDMTNVLAYEKLVITTSFDICILSILCTVWVTVVFALSRRYKTVPHQFTLALLLSHFLACTGMLLFNTLNKEVLWHRYVEYIVSLIGILSTRCWTAGLALTLCLLKTRSLCFVLRIRAWLFLGCFGLPTIATGVLMMVNYKQRLTEVDPMFQYGDAQVVLSAVILAVCLVVTIACLVIEHRAESHQYSYRRISLGSSDDSTRLGFENENSVKLKTQDDNPNTRLIPNDEQHLFDPPPSSNHGNQGESGNHGNLYDVAMSSHYGNLLQDNTGSGDFMAEIQVHPQSSPRRFSGKQKPKVYGATRKSAGKPSCNHDNQTGSDSREPTTEGTSDAARACKKCGDCGANNAQIEDLSNAISLSLSSNGRPAHSLTSQSAAVTSRPGNIQSEPVDELTCADELCGERQREICAKRLHEYGVLRSPSVGDEVRQLEIMDYQIGRHQLLLLALCLSMFTGLVLCLWRLLKEDSGGIYVELEFIDAVFNFGQGFIVFAFFGLDTKLIIMPFLKTWRRIWYGAEEIHLPNLEDLDQDILKTCQQFMTYHRERCEAELVTDVRYRFRVYRHVFTGQSLTSWILKVGLAEERQEAIAYGQRLLLGRVLHHVTREYLFYDLPYLYRFNDECSSEDFICPLTGDSNCENMAGGGQQ